MIKWLDNVWYHYKWWILFGVFILILIIIGITNFSPPESYDYCVVLVTDKEYSVTQIEKFENRLAEYGEDFDRDGEVTVMVKNLPLHDYRTNPHKYSADLVMIGELTGQKKVAAFFFDRAGFEYFADKQALGRFPDGTPITAEDAVDDVCVSWHETGFGIAMNYWDFDKDIYMTVPAHIGNGQGEVSAAYLAGRELIENIIKGLN